MTAVAVEQKNKKELHVNGLHAVCQQLLVWSYEIPFSLIYPGNYVTSMSTLPVYPTNDLKMYKAKGFQ